MPARVVTLQRVYTRHFLSPMRASSWTPSAEMDRAAILMPRFAWVLSLHYLVLTHIAKQHSQLGNCLGNSNGALVYLPGSVPLHCLLHLSTAPLSANVRTAANTQALNSGSFGVSCNNVELSGTILGANCGDGHGGYPYTTIDLSMLQQLAPNSAMANKCYRHCSRQLWRSIRLLNRSSQPTSVGIVEVCGFVAS